MVHYTRYIYLSNIHIYYTADGLHPNDRGHKVIAEKIIKFLELL